MLYGKAKTVLIRVLQRCLRGLLKEHPELLLQALRDFYHENPLSSERAREIHRDPSISARFLPYLPGQTTVFIPADPDDENTGQHLGLPIAPRPLQLGYGVDASEYVLLGEKDYTAMLNILDKTGFTLSPGDRVLELGCAAGRILRNFKAAASVGEVWGADIDTTAILWCQRHLSPPFRFTTITTFPYLPFEDNSFALIYAGSVFTHIFDLSDFWLLELKRVLRPGGGFTLQFTTIIRLRRFAHGPRVTGPMARCCTSSF